jgi:hypothetical protein
MATRPKKRNEPAKPSAGLLAALKFVSVASKNEGAPFETHCRLFNNWAVAFDGIIAAGHPIAEDIVACPHTTRLIDALARCGQEFSVTQLDTMQLSIKSAKFRALIPCLASELLPAVMPDISVAVIDDRLRLGLEAVGVLAAEGAQHVVTASVLVMPGSVIATDRSLMLEFWHGIDLPPGVVLPKSAITALTRTDKKLVTFGFSATTVTFYFEDGSWIRSQLYNERWPDVTRILNVTPKAWPLPTDFFAAVDAVAPFSSDGCVYFHQDVLRSHDAENIGASYEVSGLPYGPVLNIKRLKIAQPYIKTIDFMGVNGISYFFGDNVRGALTRNTIKRSKKTDIDKDDDIPF